LSSGDDCNKGCKKEMAECFSKRNKEEGELKTSLKKGKMGK
jgi:hypothetical protein